MVEIGDLRSTTGLDLSAAAGALCPLREQIAAAEGIMFCTPNKSRRSACSSTPSKWLAALWTSVGPEPAAIVRASSGATAFAAITWQA